VRVCTPRWLIFSQISLLDRGERVDGPYAESPSSPSTTPPPRPRPPHARPGVAGNIIVAQLSSVRTVKWRREAAVLLMIATGRRVPLARPSRLPLYIVPRLPTPLSTRIKSNDGRKSDKQSTTAGRSRARRRKVPSRFVARMRERARIDRDVDRVSWIERRASANSSLLSATSATPVHYGMITGSSGGLVAL